MATTDHMQDSTPPSAEDRIARTTRAMVRETAVEGDVDRRLAEIDREWDVERLLATIAGANVLVGVAMARWVDRRWMAWAAVVGAFLVQHGVQGWCPPFAVLRRLGKRTRKEIEEERTALKALRGDFHTVHSDPDEALGVARS